MTALFSFLAGLFGGFGIFLAISLITAIMNRPTFRR